MFALHLATRAILMNHLLYFPPENLKREKGNELRIPQPRVRGKKANVSRPQNAAPVFSRLISLAKAR